MELFTFISKWYEIIMENFYNTRKILITMLHSFSCLIKNVYNSKDEYFAEDDIFEHYWTLS